jgi:ribosome-binding factor A|tara:strand:+ start:1953 stop:2324 length:372 start_codon:yes stop_codon:yes gene_type:complete
MKNTNFHNPQSPSRIDSINSLLKKEISRIITTQVKDPRLSDWASVTHVETSKNLQTAIAYISIMGDRTKKTKTLQALRSASKFIQVILHKDLSLKRIPNIKFVEDDSFEKSEIISKLINDNNH